MQIYLWKIKEEFWSEKGISQAQANTNGVFNQGIHKGILIQSIAKCYISIQQSHTLFTEKL